MVILIEKYLSSNLIIKGNRYKICELEYYNFSESHQDLYVHCDKEQLSNETFYFHRIHGKGFKEGTFKGMDITFGNLERKEYGGLLVRSIMNIDSGKIIEGPCLVVQEILKAFRYNKVIDFYEDYTSKNPGLNIYNKNSELWIEYVENKDKINYSPRVGLKFKGRNIYELSKKIHYVMKPYRATTIPNKLKKQKVTIHLASKPKSELELETDQVKDLVTLGSIKTWKVADITDLYQHYLYYLDKDVSIIANAVINFLPKKKIILKRKSDLS